MKKLFTLAFFVLSILSTTISASDLSFNQSVLIRMKDLGIDTQETVVTELEPIELISYNAYSKKDLYEQKTNEAAWSTIWHDNLDKIEIITKSSSSIKRYPLTNLFDKKIDTAWVEGIEGDGIGEWISIDINAKRAERPTGMLYFGMIPGYLKSEKSWEENNRVKTALLIVEGYVGYDSTKSSRYEYSILRLKFDDFQGLQLFDLLDYGGPPTFDSKRLWVVIEDVYKGTKYSDTCISEMVITGTCAPDEFEGE